MSDEELKRYGLYELKTHATHLNSIDTPDRAATVQYDLMSDALIWSDETNADTPIDVIWALRQLFRYRTKLMLESAEPDNEIWNQCVAIFPKWIGFLSERRQATPELLAEYRRGEVSTRWCLRNLDKHIGENA